MLTVAVEGRSFVISPEQAVWLPTGLRHRVGSLLGAEFRHALGSLFATYPPGEAWRLARRLEFHFTPKHASWLNMAECELSVLARQCLDRRLASKEAVAAEVAPWEAERNRARVRLVWSFRVADARRKLAHLYPQDPLR